ncbi:MAG: acyltransferase family protein [Ilumatobacteraceae bacterium]
MSLDVAPVAAPQGATPARRTLDYQPSLDGLRGLAVAGVVAFHLGYLTGGFLGVDLFFTLSGYLITRLLLLEHESTGRISRAAFWTRRAWRLLPALYLLLAAVAVYAALFARPEELAGIRGQGISSLLYVTNWWLIGNGDGYWELYAAPSPLEHMWSLAIEEQFSIVWPLIVIALLAARRSIARLLAVTLALAAASTVILGVLAGGDVSRAYFGSFSRSSSILIGAALAIVVHRGDRWAVDLARSKVAPVLGVGAAALLAWSWVTIDGASDLGFYRGGFLVHAIAVAVIIGLLTLRPAGPGARALGFGPFRALGMVSYGLYLWHWPVIVIVDADRTGLSGTTLLATRLSIAMALTLASYFLLERPARHLLAKRTTPLMVFPAVAVLLAVALLVSTVPPADESVVGPAPVAASPADVEAVPTATAATATEIERDLSPVTLDGEVHQAIAALGLDAPPATAARPLEAPPALLSVDPELAARLRTPTADDPLRVMLTGDSYMYDAEPGIAAALSATGVVEPAPQSRLGFRLTGEGWEQALTELVEVHRPELVVAMWARFDALWLETNDPAEYEERLIRAFNILSADGATIAFVGLAPSLDTAVDRQPVDRTINELFVAAAREHEATYYVDPDPIVAPDGEPDRWLDTEAGRLLVRKPDVSHYCGDGAARFGLAVTEFVEHLTGVLPTDPAEWWAAEWRNDDRYHDPAGACSG